MPTGGADTQGTVQQVAVLTKKHVSAAHTIVIQQPHVKVAGGTGGFTITFGDPAEFSERHSSVMLDSISSGTVTVAFPSAQPANVSLTAAKDMVLAYSNGHEWFRVCSIAGGTYA